MMQWQALIFGAMQRFSFQKACRKIRQKPSNFTPTQHNREWYFVRLEFELKLELKRELELNRVEVGLRVRVKVRARIRVRQR